MREELWNMSYTYCSDELIRTATAAVIKSANWWTIS